MSYRVLSLLLWPVFFLYTLRIAIRDHDYRYFCQRLGHGYTNEPITIWVHCASVGEVNTYLPLHQALIERYPEASFLLTTNTTTGAATVLNALPERTQHAYLPIESRAAIHRFLKHYQPGHLLVMETELWPLLYSEVSQHGIPIQLLNARLSHKTLEAANWIRNQYRDALNVVSQILCKSEKEKQHYLQLGATSEQVSVAGNLKFAAPPAATGLAGIDLGVPYCVAASTHHDEEIQLARIWQQMNTPCLLVIVPRHPNRSVEIQQQLNKLGVHYRVRSQQQTIQADTQIYLADTLGELNSFYINAQLVLIGGSLIKHGGQNLLEPARLGKAIICGPHMYNFSEETELLLQHQACLQVGDANKMAEAIRQLLESPDEIRKLGEAAQHCLQKQHSVIPTYLEKLKLD